LIQNANNLLDQSKIKVYILDDDNSVLEALSMLIQSMDYSVEVFETTKEFLSETLQQEKSCLITDLKMTGLNGDDLFNKLREKGMIIPMIILTACDTKKSRQRAKQNGAIGFLSKPVDDQALLDIIQFALE